MSRFDGFLTEVNGRNKKTDGIDTTSKLNKRASGNGKNKEWWDSLTAENQKKWLKKHPDGDGAVHIKSGKWVIKSGDGVIGKDDKGNPDHTGSGIPPEKGWMTQDQLEQDKKETDVSKKEQLKAKRDAKEKQLKGVVDKAILKVTQGTLRDKIAAGKNIDNPRNQFDQEIKITMSSIGMNKKLDDTQKQVYYDLFDDLRNVFDKNNKTEELEKIITKYGLEVNPSGQVYVNVAKQKGDDNNVKKGITGPNSRWIIDVFKNADLDISYQETEQKPESVMGSAAKPSLGKETIITAKDDVRVKALFGQEPLSSLDEKYHQVYGPKDDAGQLVDNTGGKNAKEYLKHSVNSNDALENTIKIAQKLVETGKLNAKVVTEFEEHKRRLQQVLKNHTIPSSEARDAVGNSYAIMASQLYGMNKNVAESVMKQFGEMALYDTEIAGGDECYLPAHGSFPSGDKLKIERNGKKKNNKIERVASISVKYGLAGGDFGYYGFPGETAQYQKYHQDPKKRDMLSNKPGSEGYTLGIKDNIIDNDKDFNELIKNSGGFDKAIGGGFKDFIQKHKKETQRIIDDNNGILRLSKTKNALDALDKKFATEMKKHVNEKELIKLLGSDNTKLVMKEGPSCLISMIGFANVLTTSKGLPVIEHNHQQFIDGEYHSSTDDASTGTDKIKHWKMIWRPRGERTQGIAASYNSQRKELDSGKSVKHPKMKSEEIIMVLDAQYITESKIRRMFNTYEIEEDD